MIIDHESWQAADEAAADEAAHDPALLSERLAAFDATDWTEPAHRSETGVRRAFAAMQAYRMADQLDQTLKTLGIAEALIEESLILFPNEGWPLQALLHLQRTVRQFDPQNAELLQTHAQQLFAALLGRPAPDLDLAEAEILLLSGAVPESLRTPDAADLWARAQELLTEALDATDPTDRARALLRAAAQVQQWAHQPGQPTSLELRRRIVALSQNLPPAQLGHALFELATALEASGSYTDAADTYRAAQHQYTTAGPDLDLYAQQAEACAEHCQKLN